MRSLSAALLLGCSILLAASASQTLPEISSSDDMESPTGAGNQEQRMLEPERYHSRVCSLSWLACPGPLSSVPVMPTQLEVAMDTMIRIFHQYSSKEGNRFKLNKGELKLLLQRELTEFLSCQKDPRLVDKIMQDLDANKDNEVDFNEFVVMVAALTVACNDYFVEQLKKKGK